MFKKIFCHRGSVSKQYKQFLVLAGTTSTLSSVEYAISTHCLLNSISTVSTTTPIVTNFLTKDMVGQIGGLLLLSRLKTWPSHHIVVSSCVLVQSALFCDVMVTVYPHYVIPLSITSTILKNVSYTLVSSVNIRVLNSVVHKDQLGESYIGYSSLSTITSSLGMAIGLGFVHYELWLPVVCVSGLVRYNLLRKIERLV